MQTSNLQKKFITFGFNNWVNEEPICLLPCPMIEFVFLNNQPCIKFILKLVNLGVVLNKVNLFFDAQQTLVTHIKQQPLLKNMCLIFHALHMSLT